MIFFSNGPLFQPSSEIFEKFDRLVLMAEGRLAYIGDLNRAADFFAAQGFNIPKNYNPAVSLRIYLFLLFFSLSTHIHFVYRIIS